MVTSSLKPEILTPKIFSFSELDMYQRQVRNDLVTLYLRPANQTPPPHLRTVNQSPSTPKPKQPATISELLGQAGSPLF